MNSGWCLAVFFLGKTHFRNVASFLTKIAYGESVLAFCRCIVLRSATVAETAHPGVRACRSRCIDGNFAAAASGGSVQLGGTASYDFAAASYSGSE